MDHQFKPVDDKQVWEAFIQTHPEANFLTSWNWGQFQKALGKKVFYFGIFQQDSLQGIVLIVRETAKRGSYLAIIGGPILDWDNTNLINSFFSFIKKLAKQEDCWFIRTRPQILDTNQNLALFSSLGFVKAPMHATADLTLQLDLTLSEEELLSKMRKSTRYEVKKSQKLAITVDSSSDPAQISEFHAHQLYLAKKHDFVPFSLEFLAKQFEVFALDNQALLFHAKHNGKLLASAFIILYNSEAVYHYGISTPENQKLPGSYAVLWAAIKHAKQNGFSRFNLWGIAPQGAKDHRFSGVTLFKTGFGGKTLAYLPAHDLPTSPLYKLTNTFEKLRAKSRKLS